MDSVSTSSKQSFIVRFLQRYRVHLGQIAFYSSAYYFFFHDPISVTPFASPLYFAGVAALLLGLLIRSLSAGAIKKDKQLSTEGIYSLARHPLYIGSFFIYVGLNLVLTNLPIFIITTVLFFMTHYSAIKKEESFLSNEFAEAWQGYTQTTSAVIPNLLKLGNLFKNPWSFRQWRKNGEYNASLAVAIILVLLYIYSV